MADLIKLVKTYRLTAGLTERIRLAEQIIRQIAPDLRVFVFSSISHEAAEDASQEILKAVATGMRKFAGGTEKEFWAWCYRIARNKLNDHYRRKAADRMQPMPPEAPTPQKQSQIRGIHGNYLSQKDIEICAAFDALKHETHHNFPGIESLHQTLCTNYADP